MYLYVKTKSVWTLVAYMVNVLKELIIIHVTAMEQDMKERAVKTVIIFTIRLYIFLVFVA